jgi:hypothetical protein
MVLLLVTQANRPLGRRSGKKMIKQVLEYINVSLFAEIALLIFAITFIAIVLRTLTTRSEITKKQANIVLGDKAEE